jgi:ribosomal protein L37AE/L43A
MSEVTALNKFHCPACGADAVWNPAKKALVCAYCGAVSAAELKSDGSIIEESDLAAALRAVPQDKRGWATQKKTVRCQNCRAVSVFDAIRVAQRCDFCGSPSLIAADDIASPITPVALLAFKVADTKVREDIRQWYGSHWFAPNKLGTKALTDTLHGMYIPYWTFDAEVAAQWTAESGRYYYVQNDRGERVREVSWSRASGDLNHFFDDHLIPASKGVNADLLRKIEPFPTSDELMPYDAGYLTGWVVEQYQIDLLAAAQASRARMDSEVQSMCGKQVPGDTYRNLSVHAEYSGQTFKHVLLPIWLLSYTYGANSYQVIVNGYTGKIAGKYPLSWIKITIVSIIGIILIIIFFALFGGR